MGRNYETLVRGLEQWAGGGLISPGNQDSGTGQVPALVAPLTVRLMIRDSAHGQTGTSISAGPKGAAG